MLDGIQSMLKGLVRRAGHANRIEQVDGCVRFSYAQSTIRQVSVLLMCSDRWS
ncbi:hypothetical protein UFOVP629_114 [uncultured Caudovirales phage]|uniref:Uncharacterized protein n=1 Tax=uncultured Caudovirales phage TaxID=2100421 RepID=A0A6J5N657_9CAUD|nr:hypothetical protein UFOVP629_114 [uncultured Caudovirales phage]